MKTQPLKEVLDEASPTVSLRLEDFLSFFFSFSALLPVRCRVARRTDPSSSPLPIPSCSSKDRFTRTLEARTTLVSNLSFPTHSLTHAHAFPPPGTSTTNQALVPVVRRARASVPSQPARLLSTAQVVSLTDGKAMPPKPTKRASTAYICNNSCRPMRHPFVRHFCGHVWLGSQVCLFAPCLRRTGISKVWRQEREGDRSLSTGRLAQSHPSCSPLTRSLEVFHVNTER